MCSKIGKESSSNTHTKKRYQKKIWNIRNEGRTSKMANTCINIILLLLSSLKYVWQLEVNITLSGEIYNLCRCNIQDKYNIGKTGKRTLGETTLSNNS